MSASLTRVQAIAFRIVNQFARDPRTLALIVIAPILVLTLLGYVVTEKTATLEIGVADLDEGAAGLAAALGPDFEAALEETDLVLAPYTETSAMRQDVKDGRLQAGIVIPRSFTRDVLSGRGCAGLELILEGSDSMLAGDVGRRFALAVQAFPGKAAERLKDLVPASAVPSSMPGLPRSLEPVGQPSISYAYGGPQFGVLSYFTPGLLAFVAFFFTFLLTSVAFLRERSSGTMERLLASPVKRGEIVAGYLLGFGLFALIQSLIILLFTIYILGAKLAGSLIAAFVAESLLVAVAVVMGIFFSFYARNEFQVIQFIPIVVIPQVVLAGFVTPVETLWTPLRWLAYAMPMTYSIRSLRAIIIRGSSLASTWPDLAVVVGFALLFAVLAARLLKRQVA